MTYETTLRHHLGHRPAALQLSLRLVGALNIGVGANLFPTAATEGNPEAQGFVIGTILLGVLLFFAVLTGVIRAFALIKGRKKRATRT